MGRTNMLSPKITIDPKTVLDDTSLTFLAPAFSPEVARNILLDCLEISSETKPDLELSQIQVLRHKLGRRCLIAYGLERRNGDRLTPIRVLGKVRAKGFDKTTYHLQRHLFEVGFNPQSEDQIAVPKTLGAIPPWKMWLQTEVPGTPMTQRLLSTSGVLPLETMSHMADVVHKLHQTNLETSRCHTLDDELALLRDRLGRVTQLYPSWHERLQQLIGRCEEIATLIPCQPLVGIHRDYYPDQVLVQGDQFYLLDLDLYCRGNPNLDIGNFIGHLMELGLRCFGQVTYFQDYETAIAKRFLTISPHGNRIAIQAYSLLTLARHISISTQIAQRHSITQALLDLCEARMTRFLQENLPKQ